MDEELQQDEAIEEVPTKTYKVVNGRIMGFVDDLEAMRQTVEKILSTERFDNLIYTDSYGTEYADLIGEQMDLVRSEVERVITEALVTDDRIVSIDDFTMLTIDKTRLQVSFFVSTIFGEIKAEREVAI